MSILKAIKVWWKPEPDPKIRVRFNRHGHIAMIYYPARYNHTEIGMMAQEVACYKIKIGQIKPFSGLGTGY